MSTYLVLAQGISGAPTSVTLAPAPPSLSSVTTGTTESNWFQNDTPSDTDLGGSTIVNRLLALGAILQTS